MTHNFDEADSKAFCLEVGKTIARLRKEKKINQDSLAHDSGLSRAHMGVIERGEKAPTIVTMKRISLVLGISLSELLKESGN